MFLITVLNCFLKGHTIPIMCAEWGGMQPFSFPDSLLLHRHPHFDCNGDRITLSATRQTAL